MQFSDVPEARRKIMSAIRSKDTKPERSVRRLAHSLGYRFRLHGKDLPGRPDIFFPGRRKAIFVHGCFWHQHPSDECRPSALPRTRRDYWVPKLERNVARDARNMTDLAAAGWDALVIWECELSDLEAVADRLRRFLGDSAIARRAS
ncbi:very short patch repair endonuclease [Methylorubrum extorquens]|uniref:Very short patch repair endonuclease n=1 Tax=Methylorubrum extorquens (strain ATCC 14718 / DSM 1338 / JCM 2805 / NCIMB 9133 / AM1) TaxID=272630 RepID=C5APE9_METEA|nr:very short patch repair endonuclease [Methylorubrum extorquens]ACS38034.1 very-short-patch-repair endonuclease [Methylorubrum extorquens AM1]